MSALLTAALASLALAAPPVTVEASVEPDTASLGDAVTLVVTARHKAGDQVFFPAALLIRPFRVAGKVVGPEREVSGDQVVQRWRIPIVPLRLGVRKVPPFALDYTLASGEAGEVSTPPVKVRVEARLDPSSGELPQAGNDPPLALLDTNWTLIILLVGLGIALVSGLLTLVAVRYVARLPVRGPRPPPPRPAHEIAYERLGELDAAGLLARGDYKELTFGLSEILREYLGNRYGLEALEMTTSQLTEQMMRLGPAGLSIYELEAFLQQTDLVKFAKVTPTHSEAQASRATCGRMVDATRLSDSELAARQEDQRRKMLEEKPAHPFKRLFAVLVDGVLFACLSTAILLAGRALGWSWVPWLDGGLLVLFLLLRDVYGPGSPGKVLTGLAITPADGIRSELVAVGDRITRNIPLLLPIAGQAMEFVVMAYAADGRRIGDRWSHARVLDRRPQVLPTAYLLYSAALVLALIGIAWFVPFRVMGG